MDFTLTYVEPDEESAATMIDDDDGEEDEAAAEQEEAAAVAADATEESTTVGFFGSIRNFALAAVGRIAFAYIPFAGFYWMASYLIQMWLAS